MRRYLLLLLALGWSMPGLAAPKVVASILPLHSLVAGVMEGVGQPQLLIGANASPHAYSLKPSDARMLSDADLVVWIGREMETVLEHPLQSLAGKARLLALAEREGMWLLPSRAGGVWEKHRHAEHDDGGHDRMEFDNHLWLAPRNARRIIELVAIELAVIDPEHAEAYHANAEAMRLRIDAQEQELRQQLAPLQGRPYIVFHDAYRYFEESFGLTPAGSITLSPEQSPGARRISEIRQAIRERGAQCVFSEPQFRPALVKVVTEGSGARAGVLDPLGSTLSPGADLWFGLMQGLADNLKGCLDD